ncbi:hypothetical protein PJJ26_07715 [Tenacibaculum finnmarkense]|nr:hypothetical protein PJJ26_07715 [Tenacibaculum finnmarkense]
MKKHFLLIFLILNSIGILAQNEKLILTENENELWFESLNETEILAEKIELINNRLIQDLNVYIEWEFPDGMTMERTPKFDSIRKIRTKGFCKPLYVVKYKTKQIVFQIENPLNVELTSSVTELITKDNISNVEIWSNDKRQVLYGTSADYGIVFLETKKRRVFKAFKKMELTNWKYDEIANY